MSHIDAFTTIAQRLNEGTQRLWPIGHGSSLEPYVPWCLFGSAVMQLHGLRDEIGDLDVAVDYRLWELLAGSLSFDVRLPNPDHPPFLVGRANDRSNRGGEAHIFYSWRADEPEVDLQEARRWTTSIGESRWPFWPCTSLIQVRLHKLCSLDRNGDTGRFEKHSADVQAINDYLGAGVEIGARYGIRATDQYP